MPPPKFVVLNLKKYDVSKMCRSCSKEVFKRTSVLTQLLVNTEVVTVSEMLEACTSLKIGIADDLPTIVCQPCLHALVNAYKFIKKCKKTDDVLRQFIKDGKTASLNSLQTIMNQKTIILLDSMHKYYTPIFPKKTEDDEINSIEKNITILKSTNSVVNVNTDNKKITDISDSNKTNNRDSVVINKINSIIEENDKIITKNIIDENSTKDNCKINKIDSDIKLNNDISNNPKESLIIAKINTLIQENDKIISNKDVEKQIFKRKMREISKNNNIDIIDPTESISEEVDTSEIKPLENSSQYFLNNINITLEDSDISNEEYAEEENIKVINFDHDYIAKTDNIEKTTQCPHCLIFLSSDEFNEHIKKHDNETLFECNLCSKKFKFVKQLNWHYKQHFIDKVYKCSCNINFKIRDEYIDHMKTHKIFSCTDCDQVFDKEESFELHKETHLKLEDFTCKICNKKFTKKKYLDGHKRRNHSTGEKEFLCKICGKGFYLLSQLNKHEKLHNRIKRFYICDICNKILKTKEGWDVHKRHHLRNGKEFACDMCNKKFSFSRYLTLHKRRRHFNDLSEEYICSACGKVFNLRSKLIIHEKIHAKDRKTFTCDMCDKEVLSLGSLKKHKIIYHQDSEKKFECTMCPQKFLFKEKLQEHIRRHEGDYSHCCDQCDKKFYAATELRAHMRIHTGERPYRCPYCEMSYMRCQTLNEHVRTHTGERPYGCDMCGKNFARPNSYRRHKKICNLQILTGNSNLSE